MARTLTMADVAKRHEAAGELRWTVSEEGVEQLLTRCLACYEHPGSGYSDGSGVCKACGGSGWHVLVLAQPISESSDD